MCPASPRNEASVIVGLLRSDSLGAELIRPGMQIN